MYCGVVSERAGGRETLGRAAKSNRIYENQDDLDLEDE